MLQAKHCHRGLQPKTRLFGLELLDALLLFPALFVCVVLLKQLVLGCVLVVVLGATIRAVKWGRLPSYSQALLVFVLTDEHNAALGYDRAPLYPQQARRAELGE